jgi:hypothetical protein
MGQLTVRRRGYRRKNGTSVKSATFKIKDRGSKGRKSRGSKSGKYSKQRRWITRKGKLGGPGYMWKPSSTRHKLLDNCVSKHNYRSCLGSLMVLNRSSVLRRKYGKEINSDKKYLEDRYGGHW